MTGIVLNVVIGLVTSMLSGSSVWLWQRHARRRFLRRKARFFGIVPGDVCIVVMNNKWNAPGSAQHRDVQAMLKAAMLAAELGCEVTMRSSDEFRGSNGSAVEFCIGSPENGSNVRTGGHLRHNLPGVTVHPFGTPGLSMAIEVGGEVFSWDRGEREHALVAKFHPPGAQRPVVLISGQSSVANHAAMHYLLTSWKELAALLHATERFCFIVRVESIGTYDFYGGTLARDVSAVAFTIPGQ
ncbi:hypothetical protein PO587_38800 [Streptomyces gilvifuscus]|uniref:Secreted protein n=1 Tax=Streptomyces gilvifuscus TaxID=1550617 RepID=A0ABT5G736_9ACTN|nr:hypothetical protein [Streptomyces gilvifuscus]MDC2960392.1 hypothetical protein [Streptomyces gilvifuscus]